MKCYIKICCIFAPPFVKNSNHTNSLQQRSILHFQFLDLVIGVLKILSELEIGFLHRVDVCELLCELFFEGITFILRCL